MRCSYSVLILCLAFCVGGCGTPTVLPITRIPVAEEQFMGEWIGFEQDDALCYLLVFHKDHSGLLFSEMPSGTVVLYPVNNWVLETDHLLCDFGSDKTKASNYPADLTCKIQINQLVGRLRGRDGWVQNVFFRREQDLTNSLSRLKAKGILEK
jgi:hypothetical protein